MNTRRVGLLKVPIFLGVVYLLGLATLALGLSRYEPTNPLRFVVLLAFAAISAGWKVVIPGLEGSLSVAFVIVLISLRLSPGETVAVALVAALSGSLWQVRVRPRLVQVLYNGAAVVVASFAAWQARSSVAGVTPEAASLVLAAGVYYLLNTFSVAIILALTRNGSVWKVWCSTYSWTFPHYVVGAILVAVGAHLERSYGWLAPVLLLPVFYLLYRSLGLYVGRLQSDRRHAEEMSEVHLRTVEALALAIEAKDDRTRDHLNRVFVYAREIALSLGLPPEQVKAVEAAAMLHDIGKIAVPDSILSKPGKLTREEFQRIKIHPVVGAEIVQQIRFPYPVAEIVRAHHEKWNGRGYPDGLKGEEIPIGARIIAVVDCFDALSSDRQYRRAFPIEKALEIVAKDAGEAFDPRIVEILVSRVQEMETLARRHARAALQLSLNADVEHGDAPGAGLADPGTRGAHPPSRAAIDGPEAMGPILEAVTALASLSRVVEQIELEDLFFMLSHRLQPTLPHHGMVLWLREGQRLRARSVAGSDAEAFLDAECALGTGLSGWVLENQRPIAGDPAAEISLLPDPASARLLQSAMAVPLAGPDFSAILTLYSRELDAYRPAHLKTLVAIAPEIASLIRRRSERPQAPSVSPGDGLLDASAVLRCLEATLQLEPRCPCGLLMVEDRLETARRTLCGSVDAALAESGRKLRGMLRDGDALGLIHPSQFLAVLPGATRAVLTGRVRDVEALLSAELAIASCAVYPEDGADVAQLLAHAYERLEEKRVSGKRSWTEQLRALQARLDAASIAVAEDPPELLREASAASPRRHRVPPA